MGLFFPAPVSGEDQGRDMAHKAVVYELMSGISGILESGVSSHVVLQFIQRLRFVPKRDVSLGFSILFYFVNTFL